MYLKFSDTHPVHADDVINYVPAFIITICLWVTYWPLQSFAGRLCALQNYLGHYGDYRALWRAACSYVQIKPLYGVGRMLRSTAQNWNWVGKHATGGWMCGSICFWQMKRIMRFSAYYWVAEGLVLFVFGRQNTLWGFSPTSGWLDLAMFVIGRSCDELWGVKWPLHEGDHIAGVIWQSITYVTITWHWPELPVPTASDESHVTYGDRQCDIVCACCGHPLNNWPNFCNVFCGFHTTLCKNFWV